MSRRPTRYMTSNLPAPMSMPRAYYLHEDADFSEGEMEAPFAWAEGQCGSGVHPEMHESMVGNTSPDVTELYRRKAEDHYGIPQEVVMSDEPRYYYRPAALARLPQRRLPLGMTPSAHAAPGVAMPVQHPAAAYYPPPHEEPRGNYDNLVYRSQPQLHRMMDARTMGHSSVGLMRRHPQMESTPQVSNLVRTVRSPGKPPVTVRTPRYYRRNLYKRPSTLCLQLPHTPDPHSRPTKSRLPTTVPGLSAPTTGLRYHAQPMTARETLHARHAALESLRECRRERELLEERVTMTARSAPPVCSGGRLKEVEEMDKIQRVIMENMGGQHEDELTSNPGDTETKCSELELLLNQYEQIFSAGPETSGPPKTQETSRRSSTKSAKVKRRASINKIATSMKPRLPPSLKNLQKQNSSKSSLKHKSSVEEDRLEIEQMTAEVLDTLLQDLSVSGLSSTAANQTKNNQPVDSPRSSQGQRDDNSVNRNTGEGESNENRENYESRGDRSDSRGSRKSRRGSRKGSRKGSRPESRTRSTPKRDSTEDVEKKTSKIFPKKSSTSYYPDVKLSGKQFDDIPTKTTFMQDKEKFNRYTNSSHTSFAQDRTCRQSRDRTPLPREEDLKKEEQGGNMKKSPWTNSKKGKYEDHTALELHRSKSYIVNLIDRALSRELGTIPEERSSKQYLNLDARTAMDLIASKNMDNDLCVEISQAFADSFAGGSEQQQHQHAHAQPVSQAPPCCSKAADCARGEPGRPERELIFTAGCEEPLYIKQLKKLRWGHLKHIQREMRRLEDLERFLDSCSSDK